MRILQVMAGAKQGGAETAFEDIILALHGSGVAQHVVIRKNNKYRLKQLQDAGIPVDVLPFGGIFDFYTTWRLRQIIKTYKPDIIQTWMSRAAQNTPHVSGVINVARLGGYYKLKYYKTMDYFIANTPDIMRYLLSVGIRQSHVVHINNFAKVDTSLPSLSKTDISTPLDAPVALALARYHPVKALDILIRAAAPIKNLHVWLAGEGDEAARLKNLAQSLDIEDRAHFLGWRNDGAALIRAADICVVPSRFEPFGNVMVQAWAGKTPLVCSNADGPAQYVHDNEDALVFPIDDVGALTNALTRVINDKDLAARLVTAGYARYEQEFSKEKTVAAYRYFYERLLAERA